MLQRITLLVFSALMAAVAMAQAERPTDANIGGHIIDETGEHVPYCLVKVTDLNLAVLTDASGHYVFRDLQPGTHIIEVSYTGYQKQSAKFTIAADQTLELNFTIQPDAFLLEQVVVTASKSEQVRRLSPSLVNVVPGKIFDRVGACSLADGLGFQPGVRVENDCQNCGFTQVRINGLDGHYSQILMNSRPVFSALAGVYGLEQIPANMIERVEVMRGGGSALFGSSAIGGTINIITKDPVVNSAQIKHTITSVGPSGSLDNNTTLNASIVTDNGRAGMFIYGQSRYRDGYDHDDDGFTEIARLRSETIGSRAFLKTSDITRLTLDYHNTRENRRGGDQLDVPAHEAMVCEQTDHDIHAVEATFDIRPNDFRDHIALFAATQSTKRSSYYGSEQDPNAYGRTADLVISTGAQYTHQINRLLFMPSELVAGVEYNFNRLHDVTLGYDHDVLQCVNIYSGYLQNEWRNDRWGLLIGARLDKHSLISDAIISPRANIRFNLDNNSNIRLSYSTGFRAPQAYDEDFHVAVVGGERLVTVLAPDLKEESSNSFSASVDLYHTFGSVQTNLLIEGFYTDLSDVFAMRRLEQPDAAGNAVLERYNGSGARVFGFNVEGKAYFSSHFDIQAGITWQRSRYKQPEAWSEDPEVPTVKRLFRTPDFYGYFVANWEVVHGLKAIFSGTYTGSMLVQHLAGSGVDRDCAVTTPRFFDASVKLAYTFRLYNRADLEIGVGVNNLFNAYQDDFDQGYLRDSGYIYGPAAPRSLTASIALRI